jgi:hypothetical protein
MSIEDLPADHREIALAWRVRIANIINGVAVKDAVEVDDE